MFNARLASRLAAFGLLVLGSAAAARGALLSTDRLELSGDFRLRLEQDWDSLQADGSPREDRARLRARTRLALRYRPSPGVSFNLRLRSGSNASQQSSHVTLVDFDGNDTGDADFNFDRWSVRGEGHGLWGWAGRDGFPFWKQNELFWDDDVTLAGLAGGWKARVGDGELTLSAGHFSLPVGMRAFSGRLSAGQAAYARDGEALGWTAAAGLYRVDADPDDPDGRRLLRGNGGRDYRLLVGSLQLRSRIRGRPLVGGIDLFHNAETYRADDPDPVTARYRDDRDGWALSLGLGELSAPGGWQLGWTWARIEALAVDSSYAQDDWVRWGSATETRASNLRGHELRAAWQATETLRLTLRLFRAEALDSPEDGNRVRLDLDFRF